MSSTLGPDVVLETLGKTESAFGVDLSHFDACEQPGINLAESSRESSPSLKVNHPQIPDFSADIQFKDFVSMPASKSAYSCRTQGLALSLFRGEKIWVASLGILSGSSSGRSFPLSYVSRSILYVLNPLISHVPYPSPHFDFGLVLYLIAVPPFALSFLLIFYVCLIFDC